MLLVSLSNFPGSDPPVGHTPGGKPCPRLAILYHWTANKNTVQQQQQQQQQTRTKNNARKISASLALEKKMLSIVDVFAIFPCP